MTLSVETIIVVSLMMAVFAAVATVGSSLYLGAGFERLRAGFESVKKQTAFFHEALHKVENRVDAVEKQNGYFFQAISTLEQKTAAPVSDERWEEPAAGTDEKRILVSKGDAHGSRADSLLSTTGFTSKEKVSSEIEAELRFH